MDLNGWHEMWLAGAAGKCGLAGVPKDGMCLEDLVRALLGEEK